MNENEKRELLQDYTEFLCEHRYVDSDVWGEEPKAVDRFLELKKKI